MNKDITLTQETVQSIMDYLVTRPFGEVYQLISTVQKELTEKNTEHIEE